MTTEQRQNKWTVRYFWRVIIVSFLIYGAGLALVSRNPDRDLQLVVGTVVLGGLALSLLCCIDFIGSPSTKARWTDLGVGFFRCVVMVNAIVYSVEAFTLFLLPISKTAERYMMAVVLASFVLLLFCSVVYLFIDRRRAFVGFLVALIGFMIQLMFPNL